MFIVIALVIFAGLCVYLGRKMKTLPFLDKLYHKKIIYWTVICVAIGVVFFSRTIAIGVLLYVALAYVVTDLISVLMKKSSKRAKKVWEQIYCKGWLVLIIALSVSAYGYYNASNIQVTTYTIDLVKEVGEEELSILLVSDLHIGTTVSESGLDSLLELAREKKPDVISLCGDIYDESSTKDLMEYSYQIFEQLEAQYGIYFVTGNHEFYGGKMDEIKQKLRSVGVTVLEDEALLIDNRFYMIGREDISLARRQKGRKSIKELMTGLDLSYPVIVMDHQPVELEESKKAGVDVEMSGHTHAGQIFPGNLFSYFFNERHYGVTKEEDFYTVVSSGMGTWGFPMRVGSSSEMVMLYLK